ncbi:MAG: hypothetical protein ACE5I1_08325 [bacterium]
MRFAELLVDDFGVAEPVNRVNAGLAVYFCTENEEFFIATRIVFIAGGRSKVEVPWLQAKPPQKKNRYTA